jgi:transposase
VSCRREASTFVLPIPPRRPPCRGRSGALQAVEAELRRFARSDRRCQALERLYGIGPILACHILAELGCAARFQRARQVARVAGLDPRVLDSGQSSRRGRLAKQGSPELRWALVEAARQARRASSPDHGSFTARRARAGEPAAVLTLARTIGRRAYHTLRTLELEQAA